MHMKFASFTLPKRILSRTDKQIKIHSASTHYGMQITDCKKVQIYEYTTTEPGHSLTTSMRLSNRSSTVCNCWSMTGMLLRKIFYRCFSTLALAIKAKDPQLYKHSYQVQYFASRLSYALGLTEDEKITIELV